MAEGSVIYFLFEEAILAMKEDSSLTFLALIKMNQPGTTKSFYVSDGMLVYAEGQIITVVNVTQMSNLRIYSQVNLGVPIDDVLIKFPSVIILATRNLYQYDIEFNVLLDGRQVYFDATGWKLILLENKYIYIHRDFPNLHHQFGSYMFGDKAVPPSLG